MSYRCGLLAARFRRLVCDGLNLSLCMAWHGARDFWPLVWSFEPVHVPCDDSMQRCWQPAI